MSWIPPSGASVEYQEWSVEKEENPKYIGVLSDDDDGTPVVYDSESGEVFRTDPDEANERLIPREGSDWQVDPEETLGGFLERIGNETGWDSLSAFAREHLEDDQGDGS